MDPRQLLRLTLTILYWVKQVTRDNDEVVVLVDKDLQFSIELSPSSIPPQNIDCFPTYNSLLS